MNPAKLGDQLCFALYSASNTITTIYRPMLDEIGLTYPQFVVMMALWEEDAIAITELAKRAKLSKATMTPLLKRLEQKHLISREIVADNERQKSIALTKSGRALGTKSKNITDQVFCATGLSSSQAKQLMELCYKLRAHAEQS